MAEAEMVGLNSVVSCDGLVVGRIVEIRLGEG